VTFCLVILETSGEIRKKSGRIDRQSGSCFERKFSHGKCLLSVSHFGQCWWCSV